MVGRVLVIDDDDAFRFAMGKALRRQGFEVLEAASGEAALVFLTGDAPPDAALLDLTMKGIGGLEVLRRRGGSQTPIIVLTGHGTVQAAVEAMRLGAFSFLEKPVDAAMLQPLLQQALTERGHVEKNATPGDVAHADVNHTNSANHVKSVRGGDEHTPALIGTSAAMNDVRQFLKTVGPTPETVAIYGETGTGKEVVARQLHGVSKRKGPFIAMNAASIPRDLCESELFGHRRGAFTGATSDRKGFFRDADKGTLFIDELAELPLDSQAKLLRALETRAIRPVGESREIPVDVRIIAATNRDLWKEVSAGHFREDLYFRLQVFPILLAPLRDRTDDIPMLARHLLARIGHAEMTLDDDALQALTAYHWPGNVRELLNVLRRASLFAEAQCIRGELARKMIAASIFGHAMPSSKPSPTIPSAKTPTSSTFTSRLSRLDDMERAHIANTLSQMGGNVTKAAVALGIDRRTLQRKLKAYDMDSAT